MRNNIITQCDDMKTWLDLDNNVNHLILILFVLLLEVVL